ncbi:hypothetical protein [Aequorivita sediminis]|uniref:hypothetical protein n=1 Tax=Aequorivita sediminis TaxID=3073653 RepID=UPI0028B0C3F2|nr:hypothetical protein [Aequorivita sp. F6058]
MKARNIILLVISSVLLLSCYGDSSGIERTCENLYGLDPKKDLILSTQEEVDMAFTRNHVAGNVYIGYCPDKNSSRITNLNGLRNLTKIEGSLLISETDITTINELEKLEEIGGVLSIYMNSSLREINNFNSLTSINELNVFGNDKLKAISGFNALKNCNSTFDINVNENLETIEGFNNLIHIGEDLVIQSNNNLVKVKGFESLTNIGKNLKLGSNLLIKSIEAFNNLKTIGEDLDFRYNWSLEKLDMFPNLETIQGRLIIENHKKLKSLQSLNNLTFVGNQLYIAENLILSNYCGLKTLIQTEGGLQEGDSGPPYNVPYFVIVNNLYNPTRQDLRDGNCSQ